MRVLELPNTSTELEKLLNSEEYKAWSRGSGADFEGMMGGGSKSLSNWMKKDGPNLFIMINALHNLNVKGNKVAGDMFVVESIEEYEAEFKDRLNLNEDDNIKLSDYPFFHHWLTIAINIVHSNREIFDSGYIIEKNNNNIGPFKSLARSNNNSRRMWTGFGSPIYSYGNNMIRRISPVFERFGTLVDTIPLNGSIGLVGGGKTYKINDITFENVVEAVNGTSSGSEFIGGMVHTGNSEAAMLVRKLETYWNSIQNIIKARGQRFDKKSIDDMDDVLKTIKITVFRAEEILGDITSWLRVHNDNNISRGDEISLGRLIRDWSKTMARLRKEGNNAADGFHDLK